MVLTRAIAGICLLALVGGCGADGPPIPPDDSERPPPGITFSGKMQVGVAGGPDGTRTVTRITD